MHWIYLCIAYYSNRYENADIFLSENCKDDALKLYTYYLKNNNEDKIVEIFISKTIEKVMDVVLHGKFTIFMEKFY